MSDLLTNPAIQSGALPFGTALIVAAMLGFSSAATARFAGLAVLAGFLVAYGVTLGLPPLPPKSSGQKIAYIAVLAGLAGLYLDGRRASGLQHLGLGLAATLISIVWLGWRKLLAAPSVDHLTMFLVLAGTAIALYGTEGDHDDGADKTVPLLVVSIAMAGIAFIGSSASISQNAGSMGAALGGLMILNWPKRRFGLDATARMVPIIVLAALATQAALFTTAPAWILALLLPAFFADRLVDHWTRVENPLARPVLVAFFAAVPSAAALAAAWSVAESSGLSGGY